MVCIIVRGYVCLGKDLYNQKYWQVVFKRRGGGGGGVGELWGRVVIYTKIEICDIFYYGSMTICKGKGGWSNSGPIIHIQDHS